MDVLTYPYRHQSLPMLVKEDPVGYLESVMTFVRIPHIGTFVEIYQDHDDVIKWKHFPGHWPFVGGIHRSPVDSPHKGQQRGAVLFSLFCARTNGWANNRSADDSRRHRAHYDVTVHKRHIFICGCTDVAMLAHKLRCVIIFTVFLLLINVVQTS